MIVAVTTIAKNEEEFVERWYKSARDADYLLICDTGSVDWTTDKAMDLGINVAKVRLSPFRFDDARNANMALVSPDVDLIVTLDMDEVLSDGWRDKLEKAPKADQYFYEYDWSPNISFYGNRCFSRVGFRWKHPVHEVIVPTKKDIKTSFGGFQIEHLPNPSKSRAQYLDLLKVAVDEEPYDDRIAHYYARELYFVGDYVASRKEFLRHLSISSWAPERAQSYRYIAKMDDDPERWLLKAISECPDRREAWVDLLKFYKPLGYDLRGLTERILDIKTFPMDYLTERDCYDDNHVLEFVKNDKEW